MLSTGFLFPKQSCRKIFNLVYLLEMSALIRLTGHKRLSNLSVFSDPEIWEYPDSHAAHEQCEYDQP